MAASRIELIQAVRLTFGRMVSAILHIFVLGYGSKLVIRSKCARNWSSRLVTKRYASERLDEWGEMD